MPFKKHMLLNYKPETFQALNVDGITYELTVKLSTWWGLRVRIIKHLVTANYGFDADQFYLHKLNVWNTDL